MRIFENHLPKFSFLTVTVILTTLLSLLISVNSHAEFDQGSNAVLINFGFSRGGMSLGVDYEHGYQKTFGLGGYFRNYPDNTSPRTAGLTAVGAFIRPHFNRQAWDLYVSPGFGIISYKPVSGSTDSLLGPSLALGLLYEMKPNVSFGIEHMMLSSWFGNNDVRGGVLAQELMAKLRFIF